MIWNRTTIRRSAAAAALFSLLLVAVATRADGTELSSSVGDRSTRLAGDVPIRFDPRDAVLQSDAARRHANVVARSVPLPQGGNFNGIRWEDLSGGASTSDVAFILQYNAACQWLRALSEHRVDPGDRRVIADIPSWPAFRESESAAVFAEALAEVSTSSPAEKATELVAQCTESHARETAYARSLGLMAPR